jgi:hypothetical protein
VAAQKLLAAADVGPLDELGHTRVDCMRAPIAFGLNRSGMPSNCIAAAVCCGRSAESSKMVAATARLRCLKKKRHRASPRRAAAL